MLAGGGVDLYGASYGNFANALYAEIRGEAFGEDIGQTGWLTAQEQDLFIAWLGLSPMTSLLDVACGSGGPTLRIAQRTGCRVLGVDLHREGIASATAGALEVGLEERARFLQADAAERLPFADGSFDAVTCIDAINHLPDRSRVLEDWRRVLKPGGRLLFTDPIVLTGPVTNREIALRASIGLFVFVPAGLDEGLLKQAGFEVERVENRTRNMAENAAGWRDARSRREADLRTIEGDEAFEGQQRFLEAAARLAADGRLSRIAILVRRPVAESTARDGRWRGKPAPSAPPAPNPAHVCAAAADSSSCSRRCAPPRLLIPAVLPPARRPAISPVQFSASRQRCGRSVSRSRRSGTRPTARSTRSSSDLAG